MNLSHLDKQYTDYANLTQHYDYRICEEAPDHHYRTETPNIIFELDLSNRDLAIYTRLKKIAGDSGASWMSIEDLAREFKTSKNTVREALTSLSAVNPILNCPLILVEERKYKNGGSTTHRITIVDLWRLNGDHFRKKKIRKINEGEGSKFEGGGSKFEPPLQEEPMQEELKEKQQQPKTKSPVVVVFFEKLAKIDIPDCDKRWLMENYSEKEISEAIDFALHPSTKITKTLQQAIKWACKEKPQIPKSLEQNTEENKKFAKKLENQIQNTQTIKFEALNKNCEIIFLGTQKEPEGLQYSEPNFKQKLKELFEKYGLKCRKN